MSKAITQTYFSIKLGKTLTFIWSSTPDTPLKGSVDLKIRQIPELPLIAKNMGCQIQNGRITIPDLDIYNRLLIYACVRISLRNRGKIRDLAKLVFELSNLDAHYWASRFRELWWRHGKYRPLLNTAKAFKLFFGLG
ncbi:MAG: hypothetical protein DRG27_02040 [Deltaproteobacteria bacterium]|nr:MAG: hypothetical protein DRG27_02040 [Deltaproteobacteria bacterium]